MRTEISLAMKDLRYVGVMCRNCGTEVLLDMENEYKREGKGFAPDGCPTCDTPFDSAVKPALDRFKGVYAALAKLEGTVRFRVPPVGAA
jgi:hypothetical protein